MTRYADPTLCPDCSGPIVYGDLTCPTCGLPLRGDTAARLFQTLTVADALLDTLRAGARVPVGVGAAPSAGTAAPGGPAAGAGSPEAGAATGAPAIAASPASVPVRRARGVTATAPAPAGPGSRR